MKIVKCDLYPFIQPYEDKDWKFALGALNYSEGFLLKIETDEGISGWGYTAAAAHLGDTVGSISGAINKYFIPYLLGKDPFDIEVILATIDKLLFVNFRAKAAVDLALHDLIGKALKIPLYQYLGGVFRDSIPVIRLVPLKEPGETAEVTAKLVSQGYKYLKIKISGQPGKDIDRLKAVREAVGDDIILTIDANQSYDPVSAVNVIRKMSKYNISVVEQPVRYDDINGLKYVANNVDIPVEADESAKNLSDIINLIATRSVTSISLKIPKLGGINNTKKAAVICAAANMPCRIGAAVGGRLFGAANMHVIAATSNLSFAAEAGEFVRIFDDPVSGIEVENGEIRLSQKPGLGVEINEEALKHRNP